MTLIDCLANVVAGLIRNRLEAVGAPRAKHARCHQREPLLDQQLLAVLLARVEKYLAR